MIVGNVVADRFWDVMKVQSPDGDEKFDQSSVDLCLPPSSSYRVRALPAPSNSRCSLRSGNQTGLGSDIRILDAPPQTTTPGLAFTHRFLSALTERRLLRTLAPRPGRDTWGAAPRLQP